MNYGMITGLLCALAHAQAQQKGIIHLHNALNEPVEFLWRVNINDYDPFLGAQWKHNIFKDEGTIPAHDTVKLNGPLINGTETWEDPLFLFITRAGAVKKNFFKLQGNLIGTYTITTLPDGTITVIFAEAEQKKEGDLKQAAPPGGATLS